MWSRLASQALSERLAALAAPKEESYGTYQPGANYLGWVASWCGDQHRRIHHERRGPEASVGPGDAGIRQAGRALHGRHRDVQCLGLPAGHRYRLALRSDPNTLRSRMEYC